MNNQAARQAGQRLTFYQLFSDKGYKVEIPLIQRDYAQGRDMPKEEQIRESFLSTLYNHLRDGNNINLDFVYGNLETRVDGTEIFIPLDGQQRLTTLFLLHWYLANKDGNYHELEKHLVSNNKSRFTYETRTSSREFCNELIVKNIEFKQLVMPREATDDTPSKMIKDSSWYFNAWDNDPTIKAMLKMIDAIDEQFRNSEGYFAKLIDKNNPIITFQFMNLNEFSLTDDLYIKMNARGKLLTDFEIFKAWLQGFVANNDWKIMDINGRDWIHRLDQEWTDLFWQHRGSDNNIDTPFLNLFKSIGMYTVAMVMQPSYGRLEERDAQTITRFNEYRFISPAEYESLSCFDKETLERCFRLLDYFVKETNQRNYFLKFIGRENYTERVFNYAYLLFATEDPSGKNFSDSQNMAIWLRIAGNLVRNTIIDAPVDFVRAIQSLTELWKEVKKSVGAVDKWVLNAISGMDAEDIVFFKGEQCAEEILKAKLIIKDSNWEARLRNAEEHPYFFGQVGFLLDYVNEGSEYNMTEFDNYLNKASQLFNDQILTHKDCLLERALLAKGDYLISVGSNKGYCLPDHGTLRLREENWRKVFRDKKRTVILKNLINDLDSSSIDDSLRKVIQSAQGLEEWRQLIVECPEAIRICHERRVQFDWTGGIYPLTKTTMRSYHYELRTLHFYHRILKPKEKMLDPFTYVDYKDVYGSDEQPYIYLNGWKYDESDIRLEIEYENNNYKLKLLSKNGKELPTDIENKALLSDFSKQNNYLEKKVDQSLLEKTIFDLLTNLKDIQ